MANTFNDIITAVYYKMSQKTTSTTYDLTSLVKPKINSVISQICRGEYTNVLDNSILRGWKLPFLEAKKQYQRYIPAKLTALLTAGDTEINIDTTNYETTGAVIVKWNIINYTWKSATQLTWCTNVLVTTETETVYPLYSFPWDIERPFNLTIWNDWEQDFSFSDERENNRYVEYYTIRYDNENIPYLDIRYSWEALFWLKYNRVVTDLVDNTDETILPNNYWLDVVAPIVAGELLRDKEQMEHSQALLSNGYKKLKDMYSYYSRDIKDIRKKIFWTKNVRLV